MEKLAEAHLDTLQWAVTRAYPLAGALLLAFRFAPGDTSKLLLGLPPVHASSVLWLLSFAIAFAQLRALVALRSLAGGAAGEEGSLRRTLRMHHVIANPFFEVDGPLSRLVSVSGPTLVAVANLIPILVGTELFYTQMLPALVPKLGRADLLTIFSYFIGQGALVAAMVLSAFAYRHVRALIKWAASSPLAAADKEFALSATLSILCGAYFLGLVRYWFAIASGLV